MVTFWEVRNQYKKRYVTWKIGCVKGRWVMSMIQGMGEFDSVRRSVQKDDSLRKKTEKEEPRNSRVSQKDTAQVSEAARMFKMRDDAVEALDKIPDPREEKIQEILEKIDKGTLVTSSSVKNSISMMINQGLL